MLILHSHFPCVAAKALPVLQLEEDSVAWPSVASPGAVVVRGAGPCVTPGTLTSLSWHATAHS